MTSARQELGMENRPTGPRGVLSKYLWSNIMRNVTAVLGILQNIYDVPDAGICAPFSLDRMEV